MELRESTRRYILIGMAVFVVLGILVAKVMANGQDDQFLKEDALYQQVSNLVSEENYTEAAVYINELLKTQADSEAVNYLGGVIAVHTGEMQQAAILFQKTLDINPHKVEDAIFMLQFGEVLYNVKRYEDAKVVLQHCLQIGYTPKSYPNYETHVKQLLNSIENM